MLNVQELIVKLTKAITYKYPGPCAPSLLIATLPNGNFYVSILKYGATHRDKQVMFKRIDSDLCRALTGLMNQFLASDSSQPNPIDELRAFAHNTSVMVNKSYKEYIDDLPEW